MMMSMTYQSVREPFQRRLIRRSRSALRNPHAWANHRTCRAAAHSLSHVAGRVEHTARRGRDRTSRGRRLDRTRSGRGREAHQGAGGAGREAAGDHADLLSRVGRAAHHRRRHRGGRRKLRRRGRIRAAAACGPALGRHRLRPHRSRGREVRRHRLQADVREADRAGVLGLRRGRAALGSPDPARACRRRRQARALPGRPASPR